MRTMSFSEISTGMMATPIAYGRLRAFRQRIIRGRIIARDTAHGNASNYPPAIPNGIIALTFYSFDLTWQTRARMSG